MPLKKGIFFLIRNSLHFVERNLIPAPVIEAGGPGAFVASHLLCNLQPAAVLQVVRDPGRPEAVAANLRLDSRLPATPPDHLMNIGLVQGSGLELALTPGAKQRGAALSCQAGGGEVFL